jgi:predicted flap endonuclease-1-like 5' DNA nuclease
MLYLLQALSGWSAAALALGLCVGFFTFDAERRASWRYFAVPAALFLIGGGVAAFLRLLPGRYGFWLETALLLTMAYSVGCFVGFWARSLSGGRSAGREKAPPAALFPAAAAAPTEGLARPEPASEPMDDALAESVKTLAEQAKALAAATPAALAASQAAQELLAQDDTTKVDRAQEDAGSAPILSPPPAPPLAPPAALPPTLAEAQDDLRLIHGIDDQRAQKLHELGIWRFGQIADWTPEQQKWIADRLGGFGPAARAFDPAKTAQV